MASAAPGLGFSSPSEVSHRLTDFPMEEVPFAMKMSCPFKDEIQGMLWQKLSGIGNSSIKSKTKLFYIRLLFSFFSPIMYK